jgi:hypothetical protein
MSNPDELETQLGARVPAAIAERLLAQYDAGRDVVGHHAGPYTINKLSKAEGTVTIGCHLLSIADIRRAIATMPPAKKGA